MKERLQKTLARSGYGSRRSCENLIRSARVRVNGDVVTQLGSVVDPDIDAITVDGETVRASVDFSYLMLNKPAGYVTTASDPQRRRTVMELLPPTLAPGVHPIGRLDLNTEGMLLFTNDGQLAYRVTHPRYQIEKEYFAEVEGVPSVKAMTQLRRGVLLDDRPTAPAHAEIARRPPIGYARGEGCTWLRLVIHEGRKRQVRLMCSSIGHPVSRLVRTRIDGLQLERLRKGETRPLSGRELERLRRAVDISPTSVSR